MLRRRHVFWTGAAVAALSAALVAVVVFFTTTGYGRGFLSRIALERLAQRINGGVTVGAVRGNLLTGATLVDLRITDPEGKLFLEADTVELRYGLKALLRKRLEFSDVRFVRPVVLLDQPPGEPWNYQRIFPADTTLTPGDTVPGFGSWVNLVDVTVESGTIEVRREWSDGDGPTTHRPDPSELSWPENRYWLERVHGGVQAVSIFHQIDARLPRLRFAHPDTAARLVDVASLRMVAAPFMPPAAHILDARGRVTLWEDTLAFERLEVDLPDTHVEIDGYYAFGRPFGSHLRVVGGPLELASLRWLRPSLPDGSGSLDVELTQDAERTHVALSDMDLEVEDATIEGSAGLSITGKTLELDESDVRFEHLDTRLIERTLEEVDVPIDGVLSGDVRLAGTPDDLEVDGWTEVTERSGAKSRIDADGGIVSRGGRLVARDLDVRMNPLRLGLLQGIAPDLPLGGSLTGRATLDGALQEMFRVDADVVHTSPSEGRSHVLAEGSVRVQGGVQADALRLRFDPLTAGFVRAFQPGFRPEGTITGTAVLTGSAARGFDVDADVVHDSEETGPSHLLAKGDVLLRDGLELRGLQVHMDPLQTRLIRTYRPDLDVEGVLVGDATLNGSTTGRLSAVLDVLHRAPTGESAAQGTAVFEEDVEGTPFFDVDVLLRPLALATLGRWLPAARLRGSASGRLALRGTTESSALDLALIVEGGGRIAAQGTVGLGATARYDLRTTVSGLDASAVSSLAPVTALTGRVDVAGVGTDARSADARIDLRLVDSAVKGSTLDSTRVRARLQGGLAQIEEGNVRLASGSADVRGSFGLVPERRGTLSYDVAVESLEDFRELLPDSLIPADTARVADRPLPRMRGLAQARADSARAAEDSLVASVATGRPLTAPLPLDTAAPLPRDSISGSVRAQGTLEGNLESFEARGTADLERVVFAGSAIQDGRLAYAFTDPRAERGHAELELTATTVRVQGFVFDSASVRFQHDGRFDLGSGRVELHAFQDPARDYSLAADYTLAADASTLMLERLALRFDSTTWSSSQPGVVRWGGREVRLEHIELLNGRGGRIFANGVLPDGVPGDLTLEVDDFDISNLTGLLQDTSIARGMVDLDARMTGTLEAPSFQGTLAVDSLTRRGVRMPPLTGSFRYAEEELAADVRVQDGARTMLQADVRLPVNLALRGASGDRLLDREMDVQMVLDSLPLELLPAFSPAVQELSGRAWGTVRARGTPGEPAMSGELRLAGASASVPEAGVLLTDGRGAVSLDGDRVRVDSLVATSGQGELRVSGSIGVETITNPVFDLDIAATSATVLRNRHGDDVEADLDLQLTGPLEAPSVTGEIRVQEGVIAVPEPENLRRATRLDDPTLLGVYDALRVPPALRPRASLLRKVDVEVAVRIERDTWIRNSDLHAEIYTPDIGTPLRVRSDSETGALVIDGVVLTDRGEYSVAGRRVEVTTGSITFVGLPQPDPLLQLNAQYEVPRPGRQTLIILVNVGGYLSAPRISLSSNSQPPLTESDLLSYLAFGRESSSLLATSGGSGIVGDALGEIGVLAEQQLWGLGLGALTDALFTTVERGGQDFGLDVFRVSAATLPDELNYAGYFRNTLRSIEIEAGEYVMRSRLFLSSRARVGGSVPGLGAEYRTPRGLVWRTTWEDRFLPSLPTLGLQTPGRSRVFGTFLLWNRRY